MNEILNDCFAVIDVETNWNNEVMSIGIVLADVFDFDVIDKGYYIVYPECKTGGLYSHVLRSTDKELIRDCSRNEALNHICGLLKKTQRFRYFSVQRAVRLQMPPRITRLYLARHSARRRQSEH